MQKKDWIFLYRNCCSNIVVLSVYLEIWMELILQEMNLKVTQDIKQYMKVSFKNIIKTSEYTTKENTTNFKTK